MSEELIEEISDNVVDDIKKDKKKKTKKNVETVMMRRKSVTVYRSGEDIEKALRDGWEIV